MFVPISTPADLSLELCPQVFVLFLLTTRHMHRHWKEDLCWYPMFPIVKVILSMMIDKRNLSSTACPVVWLEKLPSSH